jgi:DNA adenine methylase
MTSSSNSSESSKVLGPFEMTVEQHQELLDVITQLQGKVMISGYASRMYDTRLAGWARHEFRLPNNAAAGVMKRDMTEVVWCNFTPINQSEVPADATDRSADRGNPVLV